MKFCKNLQRLAAISDPEWAPYWPNYRMLKKLINDLPIRLVPYRPAVAQRSYSMHSLDSTSTACSRRGQHRGDIVLEVEEIMLKQPPTTANAVTPDHVPQAAEILQTIGRDPGEVAYFKLLHAEFKKASHFFDKMQEEFAIRVDRVRVGLDILKEPKPGLVIEKWSLLAKNIFRLYRDLLLFEIFAIMAYCSFSKILKKHDMVTGHETRGPFMSKVVNKANFTCYPQLLEMISRCEDMYEEVTDRLIQGGREGLYEDERLFIHMIHQLNRQMSDTAEEEGVARMDSSTRHCIKMPTMPFFPEESSQSTKALLSLVKENDQAADTTQRSHDSSDSDDDEGEDIASKRPATDLSRARKRRKEE